MLLCLVAFDFWVPRLSTCAVLVPGTSCDHATGATLVTYSTCFTLHDSLLVHTFPGLARAFFRAVGTG